MSRKLAMARRCQLLTGSFDGNQIACPCEESQDCMLTELEREHYKKHPTIIDTLNQQLDTFNQLKELQNAR